MRSKNRIKMDKNKKRNIHADSGSASSGSQEDEERHEEGNPIINQEDQAHGGGTEGEGFIHQEQHNLNQRRNDILSPSVLAPGTTTAASTQPNPRTTTSPLRTPAFISPTTPQSTANATPSTILPTAPQHTTTKTTAPMNQTGHPLGSQIDELQQAKLEEWRNNVKAFCSAFARDMSILKGARAKQKAPSAQPLQGKQGSAIPPVDFVSYRDPNSNNPYNTDGQQTEDEKEKLIGKQELLNHVSNLTNKNKAPTVNINNGNYRSNDNNSEQANTKNNTLSIDEFKTEVSKTLQYLFDYHNIPENYKTEFFTAMVPDVQIARPILVDQANTVQSNSIATSGPLMTTSVQPSMLNQANMHTSMASSQQIPISLQNINPMAQPGQSFNPNMAHRPSFAPPMAYPRPGFSMTQQNSDYAQYMAQSQPGLAQTMAYSGPGFPSYMSNQDQTVYSTMAQSFNDQQTPGFPTPTRQTMPDSTHRQQSHQVHFTDRPPNNSFMTFRPDNNEGNSSGYEYGATPAFNINQSSMRRGGFRSTSRNRQQGTQNNANDNMGYSSTSDQYGSTDIPQNFNTTSTDSEYENMQIPLLPDLGEHLSPGNSTNFEEKYLKTFINRYKHCSYTQMTDSKAKVKNKITQQYNILISMFSQITQERNNHQLLLRHQFKMGRRDMWCLKNELQYINSKLPAMQKLSESFRPSIRYPNITSQEARDANQIIKTIQKQCAKLKDETDFNTFWGIILMHGEKHFFDESHYELCLGTALPNNMVKVFTDLQQSEPRTLNEKLDIMHLRFGSMKTIIDHRQELADFSADPDEPLEQTMYRFDEISEKANLDSLSSASSRDRDRRNALLKALPEHIQYALKVKEIEMGFEGKHMPFEQLFQYAKVLKLQKPQEPQQKTRSVNAVTSIEQYLQSESDSEEEEDMQQEKDIAKGVMMAANDRLKQLRNKKFGNQRKPYFDMNKSISRAKSISMRHMSPEKRQRTEGPRPSERKPEPSRPYTAAYDNIMKGFTSKRSHSGEPIPRTSNSSPEPGRMTSPSPSRSNPTSTLNNLKTQTSSDELTRKLEQMINESKRQKEEDFKKHEEALKIIDEVSNKYNLRPRRQQSYGPYNQNPQQNRYAPQYDQQKYTDRNYQNRQSRFDNFQNQRNKTDSGQWQTQSRSGTPDGLRKLPWQQMTKNPKNEFIPNGNYRFKYEPLTNNQITDTDNISDFYHQLGTKNIWKKVFVLRSGPCAIVPLDSKEEFDKNIVTNHAKAVFLHSMEEAFEMNDCDFSTSDFYGFDEQLDQKN